MQGKSYHCTVGTIHSRNKRSRKPLNRIAPGLAMPFAACNIVLDFRCRKALELHLRDNIAGFHGIVMDYDDCSHHFVSAPREPRKARPGSCFVFRFGQYSPSAEYHRIRRQNDLVRHQGSDMLRFRKRNPAGIINRKFMLARGLIAIGRVNQGGLYAYLRQQIKPAWGSRCQNQILNYYDRISFQPAPRLYDGT